MRLGLYIPPFDELADPALVARLCAQAEEAGWDGALALGERELDSRRARVLVPAAKVAVGAGFAMDAWGWEPLQPRLDAQGRAADWINRFRVSRCDAFWAVAVQDSAGAATGSRPSCAMRPASSWRFQRSMIRPSRKRRMVIASR
jgi:hypothetical protein